MKIACFSYVRFSTPKQLFGHSLGRQTALSDDWLQRHPGHYLDESIQDLGVSGLHGKNHTEGALSEFIVAVEGGKVKKGSVLLVESLDRLSREEVEDALELFLKIIRLGIVIVTLAPPEVEFKKGHLDMSKLVIAIIVMSRAHEESALKSDRLMRKWAERRVNILKKKLTSVAPGWLKLSTDGTEFIPIDEHVETVMSMFKWALDGLGMRKITARLIEEKRKPMGRAKYWQMSYVSKILRTRAVLGEFTPHRKSRDDKQRTPIPDSTILNYYPAIVPEKLFYQVQETFGERKFCTGPSSRRISNLFSNLVRDARDGATMLYVNKGDSVWLTNGNAHRAMAGNHSPAFLYPIFEAVLLRFIRELKSKDIVPSKDDTDSMQSDLDRLEGRLLGFRDRIEKISKRLRSDMTADPDRLMDDRDDLIRQSREIEAKIDELKTELRQHTSNGLDDTQDVVSLMEDSEGDELYAIRQKAKQHLHHIIKEIWILTEIFGNRNDNTRVCHVQIHFRAGGVRHLMILRECRAVPMDKNDRFPGVLVIFHDDLSPEVIGLDLRNYREWPSDDGPAYLRLFSNFSRGAKFDSLWKPLPVGDYGWGYKRGGAGIRVKMSDFKQFD